MNGKQPEPSMRKRPSPTTRRTKRGEAAEAALGLLERAAGWQGLPPRDVACDLADALVATGRIDIIAVRLSVPDGAPVDVVRPLEAAAAPLVALLDRAPASEEQGGESGPVRVMRSPGGELMIAASSAREDFPDDTDQVLLRLACDHAGLAVRAAQQHGRLEQADQRRDEFLAAFGHELRDRLAPMLTALGLLKGNPTNSDRERQILERQTTQLAYVVNDLLDLSNLARGQMRIKQEPVDLHAVVNAALEQTAPLFGERRQKGIVVDVGRGLIVEGDRNRLVQAIAILLTRAARCTDAGGRVEIRTSREGSAIELRVRDDGPAIEIERMPHVFDPFATTDEALTGRHGSFGLNLGLALMRGLIGLHKGAVTVSRGPDGRGTEFTVVLAALAERRPAERAVVPPTSGSADLAKGLRVLVVDDNVDAADALAMVLESNGLVVKVAYGALQALQLAESRRFDVAILDIGLPVMDGFELAQKLRRSKHGTALVMFALTGFAGEADRQRSREVGFRRHFVKPLDSSVLVGAIVQDAGRGPRGQA
ncbi:MAG TPA: response regulator [Kofleriaceae bacterium]|nr:response regulator [Kofleriaceae bacterium]